MASERQEFEQKLQDAAAGRLNSLQFNGSRLLGENLVRIAQIIRHAPKLHYIGFNTGLNEAAVALIADAVSHRSDVQHFGLTNIRISAGNARKLASGLAPNRGLQTLKFSWSVPDGETLDHLTDLVADLPKLRQLFLAGGEWAQENHDKLAHALADKHDLTAMELSPGTNPQDRSPLNQDAFEEALLHHPHPNLIHFRGNTSPAIAGATAQAARSHTQSSDFLQVLAGLPEADDYPALARHIPAAAIAAVEAQKTVLKQSGAFGFGGGERYEAFLAGLPRLPDPLPETGLEEALFTSDAEGFTPLENPRTWREHPDLLEWLVREAPLKQERLNRKSEKGTSLLEAAFAFLPARQVLPVLNHLGIHIRSDALLDEQDAPTPLLRHLLVKQELGQLFTTDNWCGANGDELNACIRRMPEESAPFIPPLATLRLQLHHQPRSGAAQGR